MRRSQRQEDQSEFISTSTTENDPTPALTAYRLIISTITACCHYPWQPETMQESTYRSGLAVQTTGTTSDSGFGHLTSIDLPELSPVNRKLRASNYREQFQQLFSYNDFRNWLRPRFQTGATWIGDSSTDTTVKRLNRLDFDKYFSYKNSDFFDIEKDWLLDQRFDMVYIDFDPCDFTRLFSHLRNGSPTKTTFVIHNAKRVDEKKGIEWLRNNSISRSDRTFEIGSGLTLFCLD